jgi:hypothetical protein
MAPPLQLKQLSQFDHTSNDLTLSIEEVGKDLKILKVAHIIFPPATQQYFIRPNWTGSLGCKGNAIDFGPSSSYNSILSVKRILSLYVL